jgi:Flp pilus assembly protein CpaB
MRGPRLLLLIGAIVLLAIVGVVFLMSGGDDGGDAEGTPGAEGTGDGSSDGGGRPSSQRSVDLVEIVVASQNLPRGITIPEDGVGIQPWPREALPEEGNYFLAEEIGDVVGRIARTDIFRGSPILSRQIVDNLSEIARTGSDAAAIMNGLPADTSWQAIAVPLDPSGLGQVAYGIQDGDYVDVILTFLYVDVDPTFQTRLPNTVSLITRIVGEEGQDQGLTIGAPRQGRIEPSPLTPDGVLLGPSETSQRPRLVTQRTVTNAFVVHVGYFPQGGDFIGATPTPEELPTAVPPPPGEGSDEQQQQQPTALPTATPYIPLIITLAVSAQDALVLAWAIDAQIPITLTLRQAGDDRVIQTEPVTLDYMIRNYNAAPPNALEFSLEPPITSVRRFDIATLFDFLGTELGSE